MKALRALAIVVACCLYAAQVFSQSDGRASEASRGQGAASAALARIADEYWQERLRHEMHEQLRVGATIDSLPDFSEKRAAEQVEFARDILGELHKLRRPDLNHADLLTFQVLEWELGTTIEAAKYYWLPFQVTPNASSLPYVQAIFTAHQFKTDSDVAHYLGLLEKYALFIEGHTAHLREQARRGVVLPAEEIPVVKDFISAYIVKPESSPLLVAKDRLASLSPAAIGRLESDAVRTITSRINPALQSLVDYVSGPYAELAPKAVGLAQYPDGKDFYRFLVRRYTTMEITPEEVHRIGVAKVQDIESQMAEVRRSIGFKGSRDEFNRFLKTDPRFFAKTPEEVATRLMSYVTRVKWVVDQYFSGMPKAPYAVERLEPALEPGETFGHYSRPSAARPVGIYFFNGSNLSQRSMLNAGPLILHELIPGHHFQSNLQADNANLPEFRRRGGQGAYTEGWGDYSAQLGKDMGIFEDPYDLYGSLAMDMFMSVRLVVDTGMNYLGWSRAEAVKFMQDHQLEMSNQIESESLRYSADIPGQALSYKMGSIEMLRLCAKAKKELGDKFDIREFHACVLGSGSMPLAILARHVDWCIAQKGGIAAR